MTTAIDECLEPKTVALGGVPVSRLILGANPFGGFAHQTRKRDEEMLDWYTMERVKEAYRQAEQAGVTTHVGRADNFIIRALREHWNEGGALTWIAQTCPMVGTIRHAVDNAVAGITSIIEPILIVLLAGIVGFIVIALFLPLITLIQTMGAS